MPPFQLARRSLDPGLFSDNAPTMQAYYDSVVGVPFFERLDHSPTYAELFFELPEGKLKIQASTEPMDKAVTGYRQLILARPGRDEVTVLTDPDGLTVNLVPVGHRGVTNVGLVCAVPDLEVQRRFLLDGMQAEEVDGGFTVGSTRIFLEHDPAQQRSTPPMRRGFTYITLIVHDIEAVHRSLLDAGGEHSLRILRLADRCLFSWVRDPHGNWVEMVQYAELSGPLPDVDRIADHWEEVILWREQAVAV